MTVTKESLADAAALQNQPYNPFRRGPFPVGVRTLEALDAARDRLLPCEVWYPAAPSHAGQDVVPATQDVFTVRGRTMPLRQTAVRDAAAQPGTWPLIIFSHPAGFHRRAATFLCTHLSSHGYVVGAMDHSEVVVPELGRPQSETEAQKLARWDAVIASRVPDVRFLLDLLLSGGIWEAAASLDPAQVGIVGHSFGGWTALSAPDNEPRIQTVVALAPGGASNPKPGILPASLTFGWNRDIPTLFLVAENDVSLPLSGMYELFERTPASKQMVILCRADHAHFLDNIEEVHEGFRTMPATGDLAALQREMRPFAELCSAEHAQTLVRGLTLCHLDATLKRHPQAQRFLASDLEAELAARGVDVQVHRS